MHSIYYLLICYLPLLSHSLPRPGLNLQVLSSKNAEFSFVHMDPPSLMALGRQDNGTSPLPATTPNPRPSPRPTPGNGQTPSRPQGNSGTQTNRGTIWTWLGPVIGGSLVAVLLIILLVSILVRKKTRARQLEESQRRAQEGFVPVNETNAGLHPETTPQPVLMTPPEPGYVQQR